LIVLARLLKKCFTIIRSADTNPHGEGIAVSGKIRKLRHNVGGMIIIAALLPGCPADSEDKQ
jgi:hypothetical protein